MFTASTNTTTTKNSFFWWQWPTYTGRWTSENSTCWKFGCPLGCDWSGVCCAREWRWWWEISCWWLLLGRCIRTYTTSIAIQWWEVQYLKSIHSVCNRTSYRDLHDIVEHMVSAYPHAPVCTCFFLFYGYVLKISIRMMFPLNACHLSTKLLHLSLSSHSSCSLIS